jgi:hypothetical protein
MVTVAMVAELVAVTSAEMSGLKESSESAPMTLLACRAACRI